MPTQNTPNPTCHACHGTGTDAAFGGDCSECWVDADRNAIIAARYQGVQTTQADRHFRPGDRMDGRTFGGSTGSDLATDKQIAYIERLARSVNDDLISDELRRAMDANTITKRSASKIIEALQGLQNVHTRTARTYAQAMNATESRTETPRANRYGGRCVECGSQVDAGAGFIRKDAAGRWVTFHGDCPAPAERLNRTIEPAAETPLVPEGHYAIASTGHNDLAFYRVDHGTGRWAGRVFVKLIVGGHPDQNVKAAAVPGILSRIVEAGVETSATLYGTQIGRCWKCNRTLTDEASRAAGIGPDCASRL